MQGILVMASAVAAARLGSRAACVLAALIAAGCTAPAPLAGSPVGGSGTITATQASGGSVATDTQTIRGGVALTDSQPIGRPAPQAGAPSVPVASQVRCSKEQPATATGEPDLTLYGYPTVAAKARFTPGTPGAIAAGGIRLALPADLYTSPLDFELLIGDAGVWQPCVEANQLVIAPYAYRVTDPATGQRVGRFDKPVQVVVTDPRLVAPVAYWITSAENPARVRVSANPQVEGTTIRIENGSARLGWFTTVPKR